MKKLIVSIFMIAYGLGNAQTIGNSPYASYGIGDIKSPSTIETYSMGGISTAYVWDFNNQFNFQNPAANSNLELASIKIQGTNENVSQKSNYNHLKKDRHSSYISGISIAFPLSKKVKFGIGFQPYSSKDYNIAENISLSDGTKGKKIFSGDGSINMLQAGIGYSITPQLSLGVTSHLYVGKLYDTEEVNYENTTLISNYENKIDVHNFNFTVGSIYQKKLKNNKKLTLGATYKFGNTSNFEVTQTNSTYFLVNRQKNYQSNITESNKKIKNPLSQELSVGVGFGKDAKWFISSQFDYKNKAKNDISFGKNFEYQDAYKVSLGGWYLPNYNNFRNYFSRVTYRYGAFYEKGSLTINKTSIDKYGLALGVSLPFQKNNISKMSTLDLGVELGQRGTLKNNLIRENFLNFSVGINFANKWFEKQYYD